MLFTMLSMHTLNGFYLLKVLSTLGLSTYISLHETP